jgi:hypothetical protein
MRAAWSELHCGQWSRVGLCSSLPWPMLVSYTVQYCINICKLLASLPARLKELSDGRRRWAAG